MAIFGPKRGSTNTCLGGRVGQPLHFRSKDVSSSGSNDLPTVDDVSSFDDGLS